MSQRLRIALGLLFAMSGCSYEYENPIEAYGLGICRPGWGGERCELCVRYVDDDAEPQGDGLSWATAFTSVQAAIDAAYDATIEIAEAPRCEVWVAEGAYEVFRDSPADTLYLKPRVDLYGGFAGTEPDRTARDWDYRASVLEGTSERGSVLQVVTLMSASIIDGMTIQGGRALKEIPDPTVPCFPTPGIGGGALIAIPGSTIRNSIFIDNQGGCGGAIAALGGTYASDPPPPIISNCRFEGNAAVRSGGAIFGWSSHMAESTVAQLRSNVFIDNHAENGGAVAGEFEAEACRFEGNKASSMGGAVYRGTVRRSWFENNEASYGGAVAKGEVFRSVFWKNSAVSQGGAAANAAIYKSTLVANTPSSVAAVWESTTDAGGTVCPSEGGMIVDGSIVWASTANPLDAAGAYDPDDYPECNLEDEIPQPLEIAVTRSDVQHASTNESDNINADPLFVDLENGNFHLRAGSPCIDTIALIPGMPSDALDLDYDGNTPWDDPATPNADDTDASMIIGYVDMGAFEYRP